MNNSTAHINYPEKKENSVFNDLKAWHLAIRTTKYEELINWYLENLDFRIVKEFTSGEMKLALIAPPTDNSFLIEVLGVNEKNVSEKLEVKTGYHHLCFNVDDLDKTIAALKERNIVIERSFDAPAIGKKVAFISDPFGNIIEFAAIVK